MTSLPFSPAATVGVLAFCVIGILACVMLLARRKLTMGYTLVWLGVILGLVALVSVPGLAWVGSRIFASSLDGLLRLLGFVTIGGFLIFFSVKISEMTHRIEDLAQRLALADHEQRRRSRSKPSDPS